MPPKDFGDEEAVKSLINDTYDRFKKYRQGFERKWYRSILFQLGLQWIVWDETQTTWRKRKLKKWVPTPVTNRYASTGSRLTSVLSRVEPNWIFAPGSESEADMSAAKVCTDLKSVIAEQNDIDYVREQVAHWLTFTGNVYLHSGVGQNKLYTDVWSPFELYADLTIPRVKDQSRMMHRRRRDIPYVNRMYPGHPTPETSQAVDLSQKYLESIGYLSGDTGVGDYAYYADQRVPRVDLKRLFFAPSEEWPEGELRFLNASQAALRIAN